MKVPYKWIKEYIDISMNPVSLAERLTMAGLEVKEIEVIGENWDGIIVGQITAINPHPNADRLTLVTVNLGDKQETVVCGAPNLNLGNKVVFAPVGTQLIDGHTGKVARLKTVKIRGVISSGMVCSEKELGISDNHEGIMNLSDAVPVGTLLTDYLGDTILNLEITPNRPDCLSVIGIAREIAALNRRDINLPEVSYREGLSSIDKNISVEILSPDLCPRYCASLITGVKLGDSPVWMQQRLIACGMRPINNVVDVTNYVMLECGQPLHSFDYNRINGKKIIVRRAFEGERMITLDGVGRLLSRDMLVITDEGGVIAIAGVMGGFESEVIKDTTSILLEAANFNPASIHYTGRTLCLYSEACMRFERGLRPELTMPALKRATQLIVQLGGGEAAKGVVDIYPGKLEPERIKLPLNEVKRVLGVGFDSSQVQSTLDSLGFDCQIGKSGSEIYAVPPYWRSDVHLTVDLIEEVARIVGYDSIPTTMLSQPIPEQNQQPVDSLRYELRRCLSGCSFQEIITYSLTSLDMINRLLADTGSADFSPLRIANPMTADQEYLRTSLRPNLIATLKTNRRHEDGGIRLFEIGKIYLPRPKYLPDECEILCGLMSGARFEKSWLTREESVDFYDDRNESPGVKFNDADLLGIPLRITISPRTLEKNSLEMKRRTKKESQLLPLDESVIKIKKLLTAPDH